ncbi:putative intracellular septation protein A, partial [Frankliniella fusca]
KIRFQDILVGTKFVNVFVSLNISKMVYIEINFKNSSLMGHVTEFLLSQGH